MRSSKMFMFLAALMLVAVVAVQVDAQQGRGGQGGQGGRGGQRGGPGRGGFQGPGGGGKLGLLRVAEVKKELELIDEQNADIEKLGEELRAQRSGDRPDFQNLSQEEIQAAIAKRREERDALSDAERAKQDEERRAQQLAQQKEADAKLAEILLPHQMDRLSQIELQQQGIGALTTDPVVKELGLSDKAKADVAAAIQASRDKMRAKMQELFQGGGNREGFAEKFAAVRKEVEDEVLAKLTQGQRDKFAEMKGDPFEMPRGGFGGFGGRGGQGGQGAGGRGGRGGEGGGRPQRPAQ